MELAGHPVETQGRGSWEGSVAAGCTGFWDREIQYLLYIICIDEEHHANFESIPVPQSPLQASPMNVEHALGVPIF